MKNAISLLTSSLTDLVQRRELNLSLLLSLGSGQWLQLYQVEDQTLTTFDFVLFDTRSPQLYPDIKDPKTLMKVAEIEFIVPAEGGSPGFLGLQIESAANRTEFEFMDYAHYIKRRKMTTTP
ncbi:MAG: hypothetical protein U1F47_06330 [Hyphomicrobiales bacterium]